jgi:hypothetical protein
VPAPPKESLEAASAPAPAVEAQEDQDAR